MNRSIRTRRARRKVKKDFELPLTSMMDMLVILLVFLLKSYSTSAVAFTTSGNIDLPKSATPEAPTEGMNLIIEPAHFAAGPDGKQQLIPGAILLEGNRIVEFEPPAPGDIVTPPSGADGAAAKPLINDHYYFKPDVVGGDGRILALFDSLVKEKEKAEFIEKNLPVEARSYVRQQDGSLPKDNKGNPVLAPKPFNGILIIHADKAVEYQLLRKVMYTAAAAEFKTFKLITKKDESTDAAKKGT